MIGKRQTIYYYDRPFDTLTGLGSVKYSVCKVRGIEDWPIQGIYVYIYIQGHLLAYVLVL